jgi:hypothetical protein
MQELAAVSGDRGLLLQERLRNHPALAPVAPAALSTVRLITVRAVDGEIQLVLAVAKIPAGTAPTDHLRVGGLAAPVDLATGRLGRPIRKDSEAIVVHADRHHDAGVLMEGFQLPHGESAKQLALRAHEALGRITTVGRDIALLADGRIIVEGNTPGPTSAQMPLDQPLGETAVAKATHARLRAALARPEPVPYVAAQTAVVS